MWKELSCHLYVLAIEWITITRERQTGIPETRSTVCVCACVCARVCVRACLRTCVDNTKGSIWQDDSNGFSVEGVRS